MKDHVTFIHISIVIKSGAACLHSQISYPSFLCGRNIFSGQSHLAVQVTDQNFLIGLLVRLCYMHIKMYIRSIFNLLFNTGQYRHEAVEETLVCAF